MNAYETRGLDIAEMISAGAYKLVMLVERAISRA